MSHHAIRRILHTSRPRRVGKINDQLLLLPLVPYFSKFGTVRRPENPHPETSGGIGRSEPYMHFQGVAGQIRQNPLFAIAELEVWHATGVVAERADFFRRRNGKFTGAINIEHSG